MTTNQAGRGQDGREQHGTSSSGNGGGTRTVAIFGASGGVGLAAVRAALGRGWKVRALARSRARLEEKLRAAGVTAGGPGLCIVEGELGDAAAVERVVAGADAVVCALGAPALSRSRVRSEGTAAIVRAMQRVGVERIVAVSVFGVAETRAQLPGFLRHVIFPLYLARAVADHQRQEEVLARSGLRWTAVRPPHLTDGPGDEELVHGTGVVAELGMKVSRAALAGFLLDELEAGAHVGAAPAVAMRAVARAPRRRETATTLAPARSTVLSSSGAMAPGQSRSPAGRRAVLAADRDRQVGAG